MDQSNELLRPAVAARRLGIPAAVLVHRLAEAQIKPALVIEGRNYFTLQQLQTVVSKADRTRLKADANHK